VEVENMPQAKPQRTERAVDRWAVEVMRGVARALRRDADAAAAPAKRPAALERAA
jgi:hypothetical protein